MLFLPVSLMTGYFSTQIKELEGVYTAKTYWVTFALITVMTILLLCFYKFATGAIEGKTIYQSLAKTLYEASRATMRKRKSKTP